MLAEAAGVTKIVIACGKTDLRKGIDDFAQLIGTKYDMNPFEKNVLFRGRAHHRKLCSLHQNSMKRS